MQTNRQRKAQERKKEKEARKRYRQDQEWKKRMYNMRKNFTNDVNPITLSRFGIGPLA